MGCFGGGGKPPSYNPPDIKLPTASQLYGDAQNFWTTNYPGLANAQTNAINNANNPNYYSQWQPTSFEQALGNQYFQNVWPDTQAYMKNQLSMSGMINTPGAAETLGRAYGGLKTNIGQYLSDQANQRATNAINAGLGISTSSLLNPFVDTGMNQASNQANLDLGHYNAQYQNALADYQYNQSRQNGMLSGLLSYGPLGGVLGYNNPQALSTINNSLASYNPMSFMSGNPFMSSVQQV